MSDEEITVRIHNRQAPRARTAEAFDAIRPGAPVLQFFHLNEGEEEGDEEGEENIPAFIRMLLSRSFNRDGYREKNESVRILYEKIVCEEEFDCIICTERCEKETEIASLLCAHCFHVGCITKWGKYKQDCPICRKEIQYKIR